MIELGAFDNQPLRGGFLLKNVGLAAVPMTDAIGRPALARTTVIGETFRVELQANLTEEEVSVSLYHEILEAATVAAVHPPEGVLELNEAGFEAAARQMQAELGWVSPLALNQMLEIFGF